MRNETTSSVFGFFLAEAGLVLCFRTEDLYDLGISTAGAGFGFDRLRGNRCRIMDSRLAGGSRFAYEMRFLDDEVDFGERFSSIVMAGRGSLLLSCKICF